MAATAVDEVVLEELRTEIERLSRELDLASTEKIQSAQYGLALLEEKSALQQRCNDFEALYENTKHELEITQEVSSPGVFPSTRPIAREGERARKEKRLFRPCDSFHEGGVIGRIRNASELSRVESLVASNCEMEYLFLSTAVLISRALNECICQKNACAVE